MHRKYILETKSELKSGNVTLFGGYGEIIGQSSGKEFKSFYINYHSFITQQHYTIIKARERKFEIGIKAGEFASIIIHIRHTRFMLDCPDGSRYLFVSEDGRNSYRIVHELEEIGIVSCSYWEEQAIGLAIRTKHNIDYIVCAIIAVGYDVSAFGVIRSDEL